MQPICEVDESMDNCFPSDNGVIENLRNSNDENGNPHEDVFSTPENSTMCIYVPSNHSKCDEVELFCSAELTQSCTVDDSSVIVPSLDLPTTAVTIASNQPYIANTDNVMHTDSDHSTHLIADNRQSDNVKIKNKRLRRKSSGKTTDVDDSDVNSVVDSDFVQCEQSTANDTAAENGEIQLNSSLMEVSLVAYLY